MLLGKGSKTPVTETKGSPPLPLSRKVAEKKLAEKNDYEKMSMDKQ